MHLANADRSHAPFGHASSYAPPIALDAERLGGITTQSVGTIRTFEFALNLTDRIRGRRTGFSREEASVNTLNLAV
jgi:hypothetical protein